MQSLCESMYTAVLKGEKYSNGKHQGLQGLGAGTVSEVMG